MALSRLPPISFFFYFLPHSGAMDSVAGAMVKKSGWCRTCPPTDAMHWGQCLSCHLSQQWVAVVPVPGANSWDKSSQTKTKQDNKLVIAIMGKYQKYLISLLFLNQMTIGQSNKTSLHLVNGAYQFSLKKEKKILPMHSHLASLLKWQKSNFIPPSPL